MMNPKQKLHDIIFSINKEIQINFVQMVEAPGYFVKVDEIPVLFELN
jgi:hypothetical protein